MLCSSSGEILSSKDIWPPMSHDLAPHDYLWRSLKRGIVQLNKIPKFSQN
jgi:hypothetical protein